jgi:hypothetical protein
MKSITLILIYLGTFMGLFFTLSSIGMLWNNYSRIISDESWFICYTVFLGSWLSIFPTREYYVANEDYFDKL